VGGVGGGACGVVADLLVELCLDVGIDGLELWLDLLRLALHMSLESSRVLRLGFRSDLDLGLDLGLSFG